MKVLYFWLYDQESNGEGRDFLLENKRWDDLSLLAGDCTNGESNILKRLKLKSIDKIVIGHLNINSISNKFEQLKTFIGKNLDIIVITETKIDDGFPTE